MKKQKANLTPRWLSIADASAYLSISQNVFRQWVTAGKMPQPIQVHIKRRLWSKSLIDACADAMENIILSDNSENPWDES
jgi:predicted DNA-binding transcriptional regulator AlpA